MFNPENNYVDEDLRPKFEAIGNDLKELIGELVQSAQINAVGDVAIVFESGKKLSFNVTDEDFLHAHNFDLEK